MTTFQAIIYGIVHGFTQFLPISASAHQRLLPYLVNWNDHPPSGAILAALNLGAVLALLIYFIHDWASTISSFLQIIIFRKKPMTLDERLPLFLFFTGIPLGLAWVYLKPVLEQMDWDRPLLVAGALALGTIPLFLADRSSRKNKGMFDWNWLDALTVGITGILILIPGCGAMEAFLPGALFRNYNREVAAKYSFFSLFPTLLVSTYLNFHEVSFHGGPSSDLSWLSFGVAALISFLTGLLAIGGLMKHIQRNGFGQYLTYRIMLAAATVITVLVRSR